MTDETIEFLSNGIKFHQYNFRAASIYPDGLVNLSEIREIDINRSPAELRLNSGETLFIDAPLRDQLQNWALEHYIPNITRIDVWTLILAPFLDTQCSEDEQERTYRVLAESNISRAECDELRDYIKDAMIAYNFTSGLWDGSHLGLYDLLSALSGELTGEKYRLSDEEFQLFYQLAMTIANRARAI